MTRSLERPPCTATTASGKQCRNPAAVGHDRCVSHIGLVGRKTKLDDELTGRLVALLRAGNYIVVACRAVGIGGTTYKQWMARGRSGKAADEPYRSFRERVEVARAEGEAVLAAEIAKAARSSWAAAAWLLERQYPERWGRVSVRVREEAAPPEPVVNTDDFTDPFAEVDELAQRRRKH